MVWKRPEQYKLGAFSFSVLNLRLVEINVLNYNMGNHKITLDNARNVKHTRKE